MFTKYPTNRAIAASLIAYQQNNCRVISEPGNVDGVDIRTNKSIAYDILVSNKLTAEDINDAVEFIDEFKRLVVMLKLSSTKLSNFQNTCIELLNTENTASIGIAVYIPKIFNDLEQKDIQRTMFANSTYLGRIGEKISITFTKIKDSYSPQIDCFQYSGHDNNGNLISFLSKKKFDFDTASITGKVRKHENSKWTSGPTTVLNYVKLAKD